MAHYYRLKDMDKPEYNGRVIATVDKQDRAYMEPITKEEWEAGRRPALNYGNAGWR